jgi:hypothetical protein
VAVGFVTVSEPLDTITAFSCVPPPELLREILLCMSINNAAYLLRPYERLKHTVAYHLAGSYLGPPPTTSRE